jgi:hypothetical protein
VKQVDGLFTRVVSFGNVLAAARKVVRGKKHTPGAQALLSDLERVVLRVTDALADGSWRPGGYRVFTVYEPKQRLIAAAPLADRIVHHAICNVLAPHLERWSIAHSYACRPGKGTHAAARRAQQLARRYRYVLKADVRRFFNSVDHALLLGLLCQRIADERLLELLGRIIDMPSPGCAPGKGIPIGNLTSQHLANFYLAPLDRAIAGRCGERRYLRYMDDFVLFGDDKAELHEVRALAAAVLREQLALELKVPGTFVTPVSEGVPFLGLRIFPGTVRLAHPAWSRFRRRWRQRLHELGTGRIGEPAFLASAASLVGHLIRANTYEARKSVLYG